MTFRITKNDMEYISFQRLNSGIHYYCNRTFEIMDEWGESIRESPKLLRHVNNRVVGIMLFDLVQEVHGTIIRVRLFAKNLPLDPSFC